MPKISYKNIYKEAVENILYCEKKEELNDSVWLPFYNRGSKCSSSKCGKELQ